MTKPPRRTRAASASGLNVVETYGENFIDGYHLEAIASPTGSSGLHLIGWDENSVNILPELKWQGQIYRPPDRGPNLLRSTRLPVGTGPVLKAAELHSKICNEFLKRTGLSVDDADRITGGCQSSWFADILPTVPSLWISGEDAYLGMQVLRLATCFCRRPLLLGSVNRGGWNFIADFRPTLLIFDDGESREVKAALRTSSFRGLMSLDARGISNFCASKVVFSLSSAVDSRLIESAVQVNLDLAAPKANLLSDFELNRLSAEFQPLLLAYRIANWPSVLESEFDVPEFTFPSRAIASALGDCVGGDRDLQTRYVSLMRWQDDAARAARSVSPESCLTEVLLGVVHLGPTAENFQPECLAVRDIAKSLNTHLRERGGIKQYSPEEVGWMLKRLCIPKVPRDKTGVKIALGKETRCRVHALARRFDVPLTGARGECPECAGSALGVGV